MKPDEENWLRDPFAWTEGHAIDFWPDAEKLWQEIDSLRAQVKELTERLASIGGVK